MTSKKRTSLDAIFGKEEASSAPPVERVAKGGEEMSRSAVGQPKREGKPHLKRPTVKQHTAYLPLSVHEQLRKLAFEENRKIHTYLLEGLDRVFAARGLPAIENLQ